MSDPAAASNATAILADLRNGDESASERLWPLIYEELRSIAARLMADERANHTLQPTALVHEAYVRMLGHETETNWESKAHFLSVAAETIRRILVDHARRKRAQKRGSGWQRMTLSEVGDASGGREVDVLALDEALNRLATLHERQARVVQLRYFGGLSIEETAHVLGIARSTVADDWRVAKAWLLHQLADE